MKTHSNKTWSNREISVLMIYLMGIVALILYSALNISTKNYYGLIVNVAYLIMLSVSSVIVVLRGLILVSYRIAVIGFVLTLASFLAPSQAIYHQEIQLWLFLLPIVCFFVFGRKEGVIWSFVGLLLLLYLLFSTYSKEGLVVFSVRAVVLYSFVMLVMYFYENVKEQREEKLRKSLEKLEVEIVERKQVEAERMKLELKLQQSQKMESIGTLAGGIAHDFNNILSSIIGYTQLALDGVDEGSEVGDDLQEVYKAGIRAKDLVKQILAFARQSDDEVKPIQVHIIANEVLKFIKSSIPTTIQINNKIYSDSFIMGSPTQIHQVLMNLCTNAAYAMEEKGGILEVSVNDVTIDKMDMIPNLRPGEHIEIKVIDTGMGISPQHIHNIFEPYFTMKPVGEGTGMGLAVVHGIVENYGGRITVDSTIGKGTCFTVYLPISKKRKVYTHSESEDLPLGTENILLVDDEGPIAKMTSKVLEQLGYSVITRTSSVEAMELFRSKPQAFDLVISDVTMPNMTGDDLAIELMKIRPDTSVILCTGYSKKMSEEIAANIGIKALVYKPVVKEDLAKTIRKVLDETKNPS